MSFTSKGATEILVAGWQKTMFLVDLIKGEVVKRVSQYFSFCPFTSLTCSPWPLTGSNRPPLLHHETESVHLRSNKDRHRQPP